MQINFEKVFAELVKDYSGNKQHLKSNLSDVYELYQTRQGLLQQLDANMEEIKQTDFYILNSPKYCSFLEIINNNELI